MNEIGINLKRIRLLKNLSLKDAGELLNMSAPAVSKYENGKIIPNSKKLIEFAKIYNVNVSDILRSCSEQKMTFNTFRKKERLKGQNLELLKSIIQNKVSDYMEVIRLNSVKSNPIKLKMYNCNNALDAENASIKFRSEHDLSINQPISDLINVLENLGFLIIQIENYNNKFNDFDGLSEIVNNIPVIVLLDGLDGARQRFTIAHEIGHLVLNIKDKDMEEKLCNRFASALLMPKTTIIKEFGEFRNNISFFELLAFKIEYKVSMQATIYRLKELNIISEYLYRKLNVYFSSNGFKKNEPYQIIPEKSYQFKKLVHKLEADYIISLNRACELLEESLDEYNKENYNYGH